ncbi:MAG: TIR domain-containing protein [Pseudomonadota bacterium]
MSENQDSTLIQRLVETLYGFDVFISYRWADGKAYADALYGRLVAADPPIRCFIDRNEYRAGDDLDAETVRRVRLSTALVVVATTGAIESPWVRKEIEAFEANPGRSGPLIPIAFKAVALDIEPDHPLAAFHEKYKYAEQPGGPDAPVDEQVVREIVEGFQFRRRDKTRLTVAYSVAVCLIALAVALAGAAVWLNASLDESRANLALSELRSAQSQLSLGRVNAAARHVTASLAARDTLAARQLLLENPFWRGATWQHPGDSELTAMALPRGGSVLATGASDLRLRVFESRPFALAWTSTPFDREIREIAWDDAAARAVVATGDGALHVLEKGATWATRMISPATVTDPDDFEIRYVDFVSEAAMVVATTDDGLQSVEIETGLKTSVKAPEEATGAATDLVSIPGTRSVVVTYPNGFAITRFEPPETNTSWFVSPGERRSDATLAQFMGQGDPDAANPAASAAFLRESGTHIASVATDPLGNTIALGTSNASIWITGRSGEDFRELTFAPVGRGTLADHVSALGFTEDGRLLLAARSNGDVAAWRTYDWSLAAVFTAGDYQEVRFACCSGGVAPALMVASGLAPGRVNRWQLDGAPQVRQLAIPGAPGANPESISIHADGKRIAFGTDDGVVGVFHLDTGETDILMRDERGHAVRAVQWSAHGELAAAGPGRLLNIWGGDGKRLVEYELDERFESALYSLDFSPDGSVLVAAGAYSPLMRFSRADRFQRAELSAPFDGVIRHVVVPSGDRPAAFIADHEDALYAWSPGIAQIAGTALEAPAGLVQLDRRGHAVGVISEVFAAYMLARGQAPVRAGVPLERRADVIARHPARGITITASSRMIKLWSDRSRAAVTTLLGHRSDVLALAIAPSGKFFASAERNGIVRVWELAALLESKSALRDGVARALPRSR